jgi:hypothetical protein
VMCDVPGAQPGDNGRYNVVNISAPRTTFVKWFRFVFLHPNRQLKNVEHAKHPRSSRRAQQRCGEWHGHTAGHFRRAAAAVVLIVYGSPCSGGPPAVTELACAARTGLTPSRAWQASARTPTTLKTQCSAAAVSTTGPVSFPARPVECPCPAVLRALRLTDLIVSCMPDFNQTKPMQRDAFTPFH